jgi:hypothetical protein
VTLTPGQTCTITVSFTPVVTGAVAGTITINDSSSGSPQIVTLTGNGLVAVTMSANIAFPATEVGTSSKSETMTLTNNQSQALSFTFATSGDYSAVGSGATPCNGTLAAKAKCSFAVTFTPGYAGQIKGALTVTHNAAGSPASGGLSGTGQGGSAVPLTFTPSNLNFGNVVIGGSSTKSVTIKNITTQTVTISSVTGSSYYLVNPSGTSPCGGAVLAGKTCTLTVTYKPLVVGSNLGGVTVIDDYAAVGSQVQNASATAILPVTVSPATLSFGTVSVGSTSPVQLVTVTNYLTTAVPISSVVASGDFIYTSGGGVPCGANIPANSICTLGVEFSPSNAGAVSGDLTVIDSSLSSPQVVSLSGTGQ